MLAAQSAGDLLNRLSDVATPVTLIIAVIVIGVGLGLTLKLRASFREDSDRAEGKLEMLSQFRELHEQGDLSEEEYRLIKSRLAREAAVASGVHNSQGLPAKSAAVNQSSDRTEKTGESGSDGGQHDKSRSSDEPPNQKATA